MDNPWELDWSKSDPASDTAPPWQLDWKPKEPEKKKDGGALDTLKNYALSTASGAAEGIANTEAGLGTFVQAPAANTLAGLVGARALADRGLTALFNAVEPGVAQNNTDIQADAQRASQFAADTRRNNVRSTDGGPLTALAKVGADLQDDGRDRSRLIQGFNRENNPELGRQQQALQDANGFLDTMVAIAKNPLAFTNTLARSAPDMVGGAAIGRALAMRGLAGAAAAGDAAAARVATAGGDAVAQADAAKAAIGAVQTKAIDAASTGAALSEAASSGYQAREGTYQQVANMPTEQLAKGSPRFNEILAKVGDPIKAREILANELADQTPMLTAAGTAAGTLLTNKAFGGDATGETLAGVHRITPKIFAKDVLQEGLEEVAQGIPEDLVQHGALVQADPNHQLDLGGSIAQNLAAGAAMGAGGHSIGYATQKINDYRAGRGEPAVDQGGPGAPNVPAGNTPPGTPPTIEQASEAEKALLEPRNLTSLDRVNEIDTEDARLGDRLAELSKPDYGPMFDQERSEVASQRVELKSERDDLTKDWPKAQVGSDTNFSTEAGARVQAKYALVDAADLQTSHDENLRQNPAYPQELQPRERDRAASEMQVSGIVQKLDPARLGLSADAATGAPIIGADGLVESGNARTIALKRVYQANGQKAIDYKQFLRDNAQAFGLDPSQVDSMDKPVLVRVRTTPVNRAEFARQANASTVAQMSPGEQAKSDANRIDSMEDLTPDENGDFSTSRAFIRRFMARLPQTEQAGMVDAGGKLSTTGYARVRNAVLAKAYGDSPVLMRMTESMDDNLRNVSKALIAAAPKVAQMRQAIAQGQRFDADITPDLMAAVEELSRLKDGGGSVQDALAQAGMFGDKYSPETRMLLQFLADNIRRPRRMADFITAYMEALDAAGNPGQGSLLGDTQAPEKGALLNAATERTADASQNAPQNTQRGNPAENPAPAGQAGDGSQNAPGSGGGDRGAGSTGPAANDQSAGNSWLTFPQNSGTLGIPRSEMPQVKVKDREELVQFLAAQGITSETGEVDPATLKPTQAEYSPEKVDKLRERPGAPRDVLVSSDGYVLDGHHQWMLAMKDGTPAHVIRFNAPIHELMAAVRTFPKVRTSDGASPETLRAAAVQDFKNALADIADFAANRTGTRLNMISPAEKQTLMPKLIKLFDAAIRIVGTDLKAAIAHVKAAMKLDPELKPFWNKIDPATYQEAALKALEAPKIDGRAYDYAEKGGDNFKWPDPSEVLPKALLAKADELVLKYFKKAEVDIDPTVRKQGEALLAPNIKLAEAAKNEYDQKIIDIAKRTGALGQLLAPIKSLKRSVEKMYIDAQTEGRDMNPGDVKDLLRSTIVVSNYGEAQGVLDEIGKEFDVVRIKDRSAPGKDLDGYRDFLISVKLPNGLMAEIQINVPQMLSIKENQGHKLYEAQRVLTPGTELHAAIGSAMREVYDAAFEAANSLQRAAQWRNPASENGAAPLDGKALTGTSSAPESASLNTLPSGKDTNSSPLNDATKEQPGGNFSGTFITSPDKGSVSQKPKNGYIQPSLFGDDDGNGTDGRGGNQGQGAGSAPATGGEGDAGSVLARPGGADSPIGNGPDASPAAQGEVGQAGAGAVGGQNENGARAEPGDGNGRPVGVPAGRDIPAKTGRNYEFGPDDLTYEGSWQKKATQNVEAMELLKRLQAEGRQATREEQQVLAKFIGWGASEIANNLFGPKLDKAETALDHYKSALEYFDRNDGRPLRNRDGGFYQAFSVLQAAAKTPLNYYQVQQITKDELLKAKPEAATQRWLALRDRLRAALTPDELAEASRSTQYAHYTSKAVVQSMWRAMERMGFKGGSILEPGAGIGVFPGLMPSAMANNSVYTGIEFDSITGGILKQLFPDERILVESFVDSKLPKNFYDVAAGNPPFANIKILGDPEYAKQALSLHDYFFAKTIDRVKPGGLVVFITSRYTMDKLNDKARKYLADRADLVGAIRLPQTAFKQNAGTDVVTDVIFLRKKDASIFEHAQPWLKTASVTTPEGPALVNEYFAAHPEMVLGTHSMTGKMQNTAEPQYTVLPLAGDIEAQFDKAVQGLPANIYEAPRGSSAEAVKVREIDFNPKAKKEGNYYVTDAGVLMVREGGVGVRADNVAKADQEMVKDMVPLRDALKQAHYDQLNDGPWETSMAALQKAYKAFVDKHGNVNQFTTKMVKTKVVDEDTGETFTDEEARRTYPLLRKIQDDPDWTLVAALENVNDDTGAITASPFLSERVLNKTKVVTVATPSDALLSVLNDLGKVDMVAIAQRLGLSEAEAAEALGTAVYLDPEGSWDTADGYLSGNVKRKLEAAREAAKADKRFERNVTALEAVQPEPKRPDQINASLGMNWIPGEVYAKFLKDVAKVTARIEFNDRTKQWVVQELAGGKTPEATGDWGTLRRNATDILEYGLTGRPIRVEETVGSGKDAKKVLDPAATAAATEKLRLMQERFQSWLWQDADRASLLVQRFNDLFNTTVARSFDGRHLTLPGTSARWKVFDHVKRGAWRIIQDGNTYLAHAVGSGKTFQMVIAAMEMKRLGLVKKPMMVVPNHMLQQFAREWQDLYPAARLMVADENNFHTDNRRRFVSRVALSDLDGVIITKSAFKLLDLDPTFKRQMIEEQLEFMRAALKEAGGDASKPGKNGRDPKIKQIEKQIERMEQKLEASMSSEGKDKNARFDELGADFLFVDEAHEYRKLDFVTTRQVKGISPAGSDLALDLYMKSRYLESKTPGRSLVMASGTPVTNTVAELYTVQKFMDRQALIDRNIEDFDSWAAMFGRERTELEPNAAGQYEPVTRFSKFVNVPELTQMFREYADVLNSDHLAELLGDKRPKMEGGSRKIVVTPKTATYAAFQKELEARMQASREWKPSKDEPNNPDPMIRIIGDGRLAAIDMRFVNPRSENDPDSKLNRMADDVIRTFQETKDLEYKDKAGNLEPNQGAAMMVFSDLGFGAGAAANRGFNARAWFEKRLRDGGIPSSQVAFMSDYKKSTDKLKLFKDVNAGRIRILVGSSKNMGTGVNAQQRLKALFHLDSPWYPADLEQREGRIVRQGNKNPLVQIFAYAAKGTYDENMWKMLASKQYFIDQALSGDPNLREIEDLSSQSQYDLVAAMVAEDPRVLQLAGAKAEVEKLQRLYQGHEQQRASFRAKYDDAGYTIGWNESRLPKAEANAGKAADLSGDKFIAKAGGKVFESRTDWAKALIERMKELTAKAETQTQAVGEISGFKVEFKAESSGMGYFPELVLKTPEPVALANDANTNLVGLTMRATNAIAGLATLPARMRERIKEAQAVREAYGARLNAPFPMAGMLADKIREVQALEAEIAAGKVETAQDTLWGEQRVDAGEGNLADTALSRGAGGSMDVKTLQALATRIKRRLPNMPNVKVLASPAGAPKELQDYIREQGAWHDAEGALHNGEFYLFASGLSDELRAEHVLAEHEAAHFGLRALLGDGLSTVLQAIYNNNAAVRQAATELQAGGKLSDTQATEEAIVDIPSAQLVKLKGWRNLVVKARDWLAAHGFERMADKISTWLNGSLSDQERADLFVAGLVRSAREFMAGRRLGIPALAAHATVLSGTLADDVAKQEKWLAGEARARGYKDIEDLLEKNYPLFEKLAELWRQKHPAEALLSRNYMPLVSARSELESAMNEAESQFGRAMKSPVQGYVNAGRTPHVLGMFNVTPAAMVMPDHIADKVFRDKHASEFNGMTPEMLVRAMYRPAMLFSDLSEAGNMTIVTNILTNTGPVLVNVQTNGKVGGQNAAVIKSVYTKKNGVLARWVRGDDVARKLLYADKLQAPEAITGRLNPENKNPAFEGRDLLAMEPINAFGSNNRGATDSTSNTPNVPKIGTPVNANYSGWNTVAPTLQAKWNGAKIKGQPQPRLKEYGSLLAWIDKHYKGDPADKPRLSRAPAQATPAERADQIIKTKAATVAPLDTLARGLTRITGIERLTGAVYDRAATLLDRFTPEAIKAGMVADYGVPGAVIDQRALLQGRQRVQLRQAGKLIDALATLTRQESRVAYAWMNETNPAAADELMQALPAESVTVLNDVRQMIDKLSKEAVALGQLPADVYERNKFAYLRRSYAKYTLEQDAGEKAKRAKVLSILGDQYKGRGLVEAATMKQIQNSTPEWWKRKLAAGKADAGLKGEKFLRLERRAPSGEGVTPLAGMEGKQAGRLLEVNYYPAGETLPAKYADWNKAGVFEVRDVQGDKAVLWRDFTKEERERMGEIDEARFAIAKTLHGMIHDVEVGRYLEWMARTQALKDGQAVPGEVVSTGDSSRGGTGFKIGQWIQVPDVKIPGTSVAKYGKLAGRYLPGPVWNDLRQVVNGQFRPFGDTYGKILSMWKTAKTALSPAVHMNNVMSNFVMADWHDVTAGHVSKALRILLAAHGKDGTGALGRVGNVAAGMLGAKDREAAKEVLNRYLDSGGDIGSWATNEIAKGQIEPLLEAMEKELAATNGASVQAQVGVMTALQHAMFMRFPSAWEAFKGSKPGKVIGNEAQTVLQLYQSEDDVFRLAAWLKAKEEGQTDMQAGKVARRSFMDYHINAPWMQIMRNTALPFVSYTYRAVPMMLETMARKPHKVLKLMALAGALNALGVMIGGGGDDKERKLLPEEKAGNIWGMVPKLIRMPWNDANGSPVYLDIRRFIPVGDVFDLGQGHSAIPILPVMQVGGPLAIFMELYSNKSNFTGKPITLETDTAGEVAAKVADYLYKTIMPNVLGLPGTYATTGVADAANGKTDAFGREQSVAQALASSFGLKFGSYPADVMRRNEHSKLQGQMMEIDKDIAGLRRQRQTNSIDATEFEKKVKDQQEKRQELARKFSEKVDG